MVGKGRPCEWGLGCIWVATESRLNSLLFHIQPDYQRSNCKGSTARVLFEILGSENKERSREVVERYVMICIQRQTRIDPNSLSQRPCLVTEDSDMHGPPADLKKGSGKGLDSDRSAKCMTGG